MGTKRDSVGARDWIFGAFILTSSSWAMYGDALGWGGPQQPRIRPRSHLDAPLVWSTAPGIPLSRLTRSKTSCSVCARGRLL